MVRAWRAYSDAHADSSPATQRETRTSFGCPRPTSVRIGLPKRIGVALPGEPSPAAKINSKLQLQKELTLPEPSIWNQYRDLASRPFQNEPGRGAPQLRACREPGQQAPARR